MAGGGFAGAVKTYILVCKITNETAEDYIRESIFYDILIYYDVEAGYEKCKQHRISCRKQGGIVS